MKCGFCGKELTEGAEFCPECGMILSLGGVTNEPDEVKLEEAEIPDYTPNVFRAMDFEPEETVPAMELEADDAEEAAEVVEIIPEYTEQQEPVEEETVAAVESADTEEASEAAENTEAVDEETSEEEFAAPEYDPEAAVSEEFLRQALEQSAEEAYEEPEATENTEEAAEQFAPPEYEGTSVAAEAGYEIAGEEQELVEAYPVYEDEGGLPIAEEMPTEDESLFASLFENDDAEKIEDITPDYEKKQKKSKGSFGAVIAVIVILVCFVAGGTYVFRNVLPKIADTSNTTTEATAEKVDGTTEKTATEKTTTEKTTAEKTTAEKEITTKPTTTEEATSEVTTTKPTTTEKQTEATTEAGEATVEEPSEYNLDYIAFFPAESDITMWSAPSSSAEEMLVHPYGYPVFAYAKQGDYYYVHSAYHDFIGWVYEKDIVKYVEEDEQTETTEAAEVTDAPETEAAETPETEVSYLAVINSAEGLNFRSGPGYDYGAELVVPGGFYVRVTAVSEENPGWVYVTVEDDRYPYGSPSGWVLEEYLA